jgi:hypothetical protein
MLYSAKNVFWGFMLLLTNLTEVIACAYRLIASATALTDVVLFKY